MSRAIHVRLNGRAETFEVEDFHTLLEVLRDRARLFGAREGCGQGVCGACTVLLNGLPVSSCSYLAPLADGAEITTIEGLALGEALHPVQQAFVEAGALQCAYCTPGFVLTTTALLDEHPDATEAQIREYLAGNLCRCTGYVKVLQAVVAARQRLQTVGR